jgi:hypothetical protein
MKVNHNGDYVSRVIEQMGDALRLATERFAQGASTEESLEVTNSAINLAVDVPADLFLRMSPATMVSLLELSASDDRMFEKVGEALLLQADVLQAEGLLLEANARREQAAAVLAFIDPARAN